MQGNDPDNGQADLSAKVNLKGALDWSSARQRIAEANQALERLDEITPEMMHQIWAQRAAKLAEVPGEEDKGEQIDLVLIRLGREVYGLDAQHVSVIRQPDRITPVPRVPGWVAGIVNVRGRILSVVDLQRFFGLPASRDDQDSGSGISQLVVVEAPGMEVALLAQDVLTIEALPASQLEDATGTVRGLRPEYVRGVAEYNGGTATGGTGTMLVVLDLPALLADERLIIHEEIA